MWPPMTRMAARACWPWWPRGERPGAGWGGVGWGGVGWGGVEDMVCLQGCCEGIWGDAGVWRNVEGVGKRWGLCVSGREEWGWVQALLDVLCRLVP
jgi:hypothetical protein